MKINEKLYGFTVTNIRQSENGEFAELRHDKTAARLCWMNNGDENKLFSVSFRTIPENDTGVFHILEHSVLGGSEKYPVKEPFLYLLKGSMNTFLNAMTFTDKTMFPVSSRNDTDFMNLTKVYLDAVFKPLIYTVPEIFYQEGHHTEYFGNKEEALIKGVVFNEMKGYSTVHDRIENEINAMIFKDNSYRFIYGGLPSVIPELTYEQFLDAHRKYYHPSNSYIYLDGAVNLEEVLPLIDSYLSEYELCENLPQFTEQKLIAETVKEIPYDASAEDDEEEKTYLAVGKIIASWQEREKITAYSVLVEAIAGCNDSPFKKAVLDSGKCLDVTLGISDGIMQPYGILKFSNIERSDGEELIKTAEEAVRALVKNGIDREILEAALNRCEFRFRESEEPKGLERCIDTMSSWLYGGDPLDYVDMSDVFSSLREKFDTGYFEQLLSEWLLDTDGRAVLYMIPSNTYGEELAENERQYVQNSLNRMSEAELEKLEELNRKLAEWQENPDSAEAVATLPKLPLSEISDKPVEFITEVSEENGITVLRHPAKESEITALTLLFDVCDLSAGEMKTLSVLERIFAELPTESSTGLELQNRIIGTLGSFTTDIIPCGTDENTDRCKVFFSVKARFLNRNLQAASELIGELLTETEYEHPDLAKRLLRQDEEDLKQEIISDGHRFSIRRARASMSAESAFVEYISGYEGYRELHFVNEMSDTEFSELLAAMKPLAEKIFCRERLTASIASAKKISPEALVKLLPKGEKSVADSMKFSLDIPENQGIVIPSSTSCSGAVIRRRVGSKAVWSVLQTILSYEYLWNEVRVKGGAYGAGCGVNAQKEAAFHSYCDPSPEESIAIYEKSADFLRNFCRENDDITSYIISSISAGEPLMSDAEYAANAIGIHYRGVTYEERCRLRREMLDMSTEKLLEACSDIENPIYTCITGSEETIKSIKSKKLETVSVF